jgi:ABC-type Fe3+/spermidine/putrescine transport system ATPase subunit
MSLEIRGLEKSYGGFSVSLDLKVDEGETLVLAGPSGSGKTTALNLIAGLTSPDPASPDSGRVLIDGNDVGGLPPWKRNISMVFQDLALFPHLDVGGNIAYGLFIRKVKRNERRRIIAKTLDMVRLPNYASRRIHTLSGGERQRVAIARALAVNPVAMLLDEPFSSLDLPLRKELRQEFLEIRSHSKAPCLFVTHDREEAIMLGNRIALMKAGRVVEIGAGQDLFLSPKTEFAARFLGAGHVLPCEIIRQESRGGMEVTTPLGVMTVPKPPEPSASSDHSGVVRRGSPPAGGQEKLFIPHDAISLESAGNPAKSFNGKYFRAICSGAFFNGPNLVVKVLLPSELCSVEQSSVKQCTMEIIASPRTKIPKPGSMVDFSVDQGLLKFVIAGEA